MKIWNITFNNGRWSQSRPTFTIVAETKSEAIEKVLSENPRYKTGFDIWASEFKIEGYVIEVYDEKTYNRTKNLENLDI